MELNSYVMPHPSWNESYASGQLPWDTGQPEPLLVDFVSSGAVTPGPTLEIGADVLPVNACAAACEDRPPGRPATLAANEREHILTVLGQTGWVVEGQRGAAKILGLHPNTLRSRMKKLGIRRAPHDPS